MLKNRPWLNVIKWVWVALVFAGVVYYLTKNHQALLRTLSTVSIVSILLSAGLLVLGKLVLTRLSIQSVLGQPWKPSFSQMLYVNSLMQLAKYLPGGVWHFVGRFGLYRANGINNVQAGKSILVENIWLVSSAIYVGVLNIILFRNELVFTQLGITTPPGWLPAALALLVLAAWVATILIFDLIVFRKNRQNAVGVVGMVLTQLLAWVFIGAGFWVLFLSNSTDLRLGGTAIGAFSLSWAAGYLTIFAPSGLGVREAAVTFLLTGIVAPEAAVAYATVNRFVWVIVEVGLGVFCELVFGSGKLSNLFRPKAVTPEETVEKIHRENTSA